ncbi:chaplin [Streptomyces sp. NPDC059863]|uniref:chaplin n=1 Tax=unclassified Streptomyces TaxID=2593676 RepID=UPI0036548F95
MRDLISKGLLTAAAASSVLSMSGGYAQAVDADGAAVGSPGVLSGNNIQVPLEIPVNVCGNTVDPIGVLNPAFGNACANTSGTPKHASHPAPAPHAAPGPEAAPGPQSDPAPHGAPPAHATRPAPEADDAATPAAPPQSHAPHHGALGQASPGGHHHDAASSTHASTAAVGSPGVLSGNALEAVLDIPVNVCGNSVDLIGVLNPVFGNFCANGTPQPPHGTPGTPGSPVAPEAPEPPEAATPPGGRAVDPHDPATHPRTPAPRGSSDAILPASRSLPAASDESAQLASTGSDLNMLAMGAASAGLLLGGGILYRRSTAASRV